ncbi:alpha/beta fold hydrolase [Thermopetrobacter sp. TC1]|uniref:alpha/beta fold hydrolase n=1 Tax=Thermopetrobacter sp. TC1 TaxID=1495045 RepID=UPI00068CA67C|nr:alpha/beta hydrolase [Thermopetrobacter sp. TC1]
MPDFISDGVRIHYEVFAPDDSAPEKRRYPVLLLHGFASNGRVNWVSTSWTDALTRAGFEVIVPDHRGHGKSEKLYDPACYRAKAMAADARRLLDHLGVRKAHVMGYSMGARVAAFLAIAHPDRVRSLILAGMAGNLLRGVGGAEDIAAALEAEDPAVISSERARAFRQFAERTGSDLKALAACMRAGRDPVPPEALAALDMPVLITVGEKDGIAGPPEPLQAVMPQAQVVVLPGRDHMNAVGDKRHKQAVLAFLDVVCAEEPHHTAQDGPGKR